VRKAFNGPVCQRSMDDIRLVRPSNHLMCGQPSGCAERLWVNRAGAIKEGANQLPLLIRVAFESVLIPWTSDWLHGGRRWSDRSWSGQDVGCKSYGAKRARVAESIEVR